MSEKQPESGIASVKPKQRPKLFLVTYTLSATGEETPISPKPVGYDEAMAIKEEAEKSGKYDLKKGFLAGLKLTDEQYDRWEKKQKSQPQPAATPAAAAKTEKPAKAATPAAADTEA